MEWSLLEGKVVYYCCYLYRAWLSSQFESAFGPSKSILELILEIRTVHLFELVEQNIYQKNQDV